jgi:hypothetical protein
VVSQVRTGQVDRLEWLVRIETTSNQAYLATSSRARHLVAASELLSRSTTEWVEEAVAAAPAGSVHLVTAVSGVAILLAGDRAHAREIIRNVTSRALTDAPGLIVHGAISRLNALDGAGFADALSASAVRLAVLRSDTGDGAAADLMLPLVAPCPSTGRPSSGLLDRRGAGPASDFVLTVEGHRLRDAAFRRMVRLTFGDSDSTDRHARDMADFMETVDDPESEDARWMAVVHADGNGIGAMFFGLAEELAEQSDVIAAADRFAAVSRAVDRAAIEALRAAVTTVAASQGGAIPVVLPLVCAGDDLTLLADADRALDLTVAYAEEFEARTRSSDVIPSGGLTVGSGVAITKPRHPIVFGLHLAESLATSAKQAARSAVAADGSVDATVDVHVLHGSGSLELDDVRRPTGSGPVRLPRSAGPWSIADDSSAAPPVGRLLSLVAALADPENPGRAVAQQLRAAAERGRTAFDQVISRAAIRPTGQRALRSLSDADYPAVQLVGSGAEGDRGRIMIIDALALVGVLTGDRRRTLAASRDGAPSS